MREQADVKTNEALKEEARKVDRAGHPEKWRQPITVKLTTEERDLLHMLCVYHNMNKSALLRFLVLKEAQSVKGG